MTDPLSVPFFRPSIGENEVEGVLECLRSGWLTTGPKTAAFEEAFAARIGNGVSAIAVNSATAALHLGLDALGLGPGDEVIVPTLTFTATAEVVRYFGAQPVFCDIDGESLCLDLADAERCVTPRTRAIMPVHFAGRPCHMTEVAAFARRHSLGVLDDAAHAFPAHHRGDPIGACAADATAFSFYANKTMTTGEGGMLVTRDPAIAARARTMRLHGIDRDVFNRFSDPRAGWIYDVVAPGFKYNMPDMAAALGLAQLARIDTFLADRQRAAERYDAALSDLPLILPPHAAKGDQHAWHLYIVQLAADAPIDRDAFIIAMKEAGIGCSVHYRPLHQMTVWRPHAGSGNFPAADRYFSRCVSLPLFMAMTREEQDRVVHVVRTLLT